MTNVCKTYFRLFACCTTFTEFNFTRLLETRKLIVQTGSYFCNPPIPSARSSAAGEFLESVTLYLRKPLPFVCFGVPSCYIPPYGYSTIERTYLLPLSTGPLLYLILLHFCLLSYVSELLALFFYGFGGMGLKSGFPGSHPSFPRSMRGGGGMTASSSPA